MNMRGFATRLAGQGVLLMRTYTTAVFALLSLMFSSFCWSADFAKGREAYDSGDYETALTEWKVLADEGDADGQFGMGLLHANGFGVPFDNQQTLTWYQLAAEQGHAEAQCNLAVMHENGWGVPQSDDAAFKWYSQAAQQGVTQAQNSVSKMYLRGFGVKKDAVQAYKWLTIAAELGDVSAGFKRDGLAEKLSPEDVAKGDGLAGTWIAENENLLAKY